MQIPNQLGTNQDDVPLTRDEYKKIEKAIKQPQFAELMGDYMKEISDPSNREEYDQYLRQLEKDKELPKGMQLIKPEPHFCLKTTMWSKTNRKHEQKFFINICSTAVIEQPNSEEVQREGQRGQNWRLPYSIGKIRYDQDKKGQICNTVDVAFHPISIGLSNRVPGFQNMMCSTAIEAAKKQLGERQEEISKDFKVLKHTKCKGGEPALLPVRVDKKGKPTNELDSRQGGMQNAQTKLQKDINEMRQENQQQKEKEHQEDLAEVDDVQIKESDEIESTAVSQPKYRFIYSYPADFGDFIETTYAIKKLPNQLGCDIKLPKVSKFSEIQLDISDMNLILDVPQKYYLEAKLPYPIDQGEIQAKFDSKNRILKLRVPIQKDYLVQRYKEEVEEIQKRNELIKDDIQEDEFNNSNYQTGFLPEVKIEEIEQIKEQIIEEQQQQQEQQEQQIQYQQLEYNTRFTEDSIFLIVKIKDYRRDDVKIKKDKIQLLILNQPTVYQYNFIHFQFSQDCRLLSIDYVIDYIVFKYQAVQNLQIEIKGNQFKYIQNRLYCNSIYRIH